MKFWIWLTVGVLTFLGSILLAMQPLLGLHPQAKTFLLILGLEFLFIPSVAVIVFGRKWNLWHETAKDESNAERDVRWTRDVILTFVYFGLLALFLFCISVVVPFSFFNSTKILGMGFLYAGAFFAVGAFFGFLFGIPRSIRGAREATKTSDSGDATATSNVRPPTYIANTNLEEISDWLTKIIVGLGLINLKSFPDYLKKAASFFSDSCGKEYCESISLALMLHFFVCGFFLGYLMTRLYLTGAFSRADTSGTVEPPGDAELKVDMTPI